GVYANHLWESNAWQFLDDLTPGRVRSVESNFHHWARPFLPDLPDSYGAPTLGRRLRKMHYSASKQAARKINGLKRRARNFAGPVSRAMEKLTQVNQSESDARRKVFQEVYQRNLWGSDGGSKFFSGVGSRGHAAQNYVRHMAELLSDHAKERDRPLTIVDLGC